jgi:hypothetical protein
MRNNIETLRRCQLAYDNASPPEWPEEGEEEEDDYCIECRSYGCRCDEMYEYYRASETFQRLVILRR